MPKDRLRHLCEIHLERDAVLREIKIRVLTPFQSIRNSDDHPVALLPITTKFSRQAGHDAQ